MLIKSEQLIEFFIKNNIDRSMLENNSFKEIINDIISRINSFKDCSLNIDKNSIIVSSNKESSDKIYYKLTLEDSKKIQITDTLDKIVDDISKDSKKNTITTSIKMTDFGIDFSSYYEGLSNVTTKSNDNYSKTEYIRILKKYDLNGIEYYEKQEKWEDDSENTDKIVKERVYPDVMKVTNNSNIYPDLYVYISIPYKNNERNLPGFNIGTDFSNIDYFVKPIEKPSIEEYKSMMNTPGMEKYLRARFGVNKDRIDFEYKDNINKKHNI